MQVTKLLIKVLETSADYQQPLILILCCYVHLSIHPNLLPAFKAFK